MESVRGQRLLAVTAGAGILMFTTLALAFYPLVVESRRAHGAATVGAEKAIIIGMALCFVFLAIFSAWILTESLSVVRWDGTGIEKRFFRWARRLDWADLTDYKLLDSPSVRLTGRSGSQISLYLSLMKDPEALTEEIERHVNPLRQARMQAKTRQVTDA